MLYIIHTLVALNNPPELILSSVDCESLRVLGILPSKKSLGEIEGPFGRFSLFFGDVERLRFLILKMSKVSLSVSGFRTFTVS